MRERINFLIAVALIISTVIGAGVFGVPYAFSKSGFFIGTLHLIIVGGMVTIMTLFMGEVVLRTKETSQFTGLAEKYLGKWGKWLMFGSMFFGIYGALIAYLVGIGDSLAHLFGGIPLMYILIFFIFAATIVFMGLKTIGKVGLVLVILIIAIFVSISIVLTPTVNVENLKYVKPAYAMIPYGVVLFATLGYSVIPEVEMVLKNQKKNMLYAILAAMGICLGLYLFFSFAIVGNFGTEVAEIATESLTGNLNVLGTLVVVFAMSGTFLILSLVLKHVLTIDLKINKIVSWAIVCFIPLAIVVFLSPSFIKAVGITGTYSGGLTGILCAMMVRSARKRGNDKPQFVVPGGDFLVFASILLFFTGMVYDFMIITGIL